jgi:hypothetical protein
LWRRQYRRLAPGAGGSAPQAPSEERSLEIRIANVTLRELRRCVTFASFRGLWPGCNKGEGAVRCRGKRDNQVDHDWDGKEGASASFWGITIKAAGDNTASIQHLSSWTWRAGYRLSFGTENGTPLLANPRYRRRCMVYCPTEKCQARKKNIDLVRHTIR